MLWVLGLAGGVLAVVLDLVLHGRFFVRGVYRKPVSACLRDLPGDLWSAIKDAVGRL